MTEFLLAFNVLTGCGAFKLCVVALFVGIGVNIALDGLSTAIMLPRARRQEPPK